MKTRVYQFGCLQPTRNELRVRHQLRSAHDYANEHVAIERGRRSAIRAILNTPEIREAEDRVRCATKEDRKKRKRELYALRKARLKSARCEGGHWAVAEDEADRYPYSALYETDRIELLARSIRGDARDMTPTYWGTYLTIEASADQQRKMAFYDDDGVTPTDPRFRRWRGAGQIGMQLQGGLATPNAIDGSDTRVRLALEPRSHHRLRRGILSIRVGSVGRAPDWAEVPIALHRDVPDMARWKWVRVSCRREGPWERWSCEITLELPALPAAAESRQNRAIAVEVAWDRPDDAILAAYWLDSEGQRGTVTLPLKIEGGLKKASDIRSIRDTMRSDLATRLARALREDGETKPAWLAEATNTMHLWKSCERFHQFVDRWRTDRWDGARPAYEILDAWWERDRHLWEYETGARVGALRYRKDFYRSLARRWERDYAVVLLDDRDLSREARWGEASDVRFIAGPSEFRSSIAQAFGQSRTVEHPWPRKEERESGDGVNWCERACGAWMAGSARESEIVSEIWGERGGAWAKRRARRRLVSAESVGAREADSKSAE